MSHTMRRKPAVLLLFVLLTFSAAACQAPDPESLAVGDREAINREMPLVTEYENRRNGVKNTIGFLASLEAIDAASIVRVKEFLNIEHVYYEASLISLARGKMDSYRSFVHLAEQELERVRAVLLPHLEALDAQASTGARRESAPLVSRLPRGHTL